GQWGEAAQVRLDVDLERIGEVCLVFGRRPSASAMLHAFIAAGLYRVPVPAGWARVGRRALGTDAPKLAAMGLYVPGWVGEAMAVPVTTLGSRLAEIRDIADSHA